jgi:hypothetical protein
LLDTSGASDLFVKDVNQSGSDLEMVIQVHTTFVKDLINNLKAKSDTFNDNTLSVRRFEEDDYDNINLYLRWNNDFSNILSENLCNKLESFNDSYSRIRYSRKISINLKYYMLMVL